MDGANLTFGVGVGGVDDVKHEVRVGHLFECRREGRNQLVGKVLHKTDGVRDRDIAAIGHVSLTDRGVERGEERVLHEHPCTRESVENRRLARVRVPDDRDVRYGKPILASDPARRLHVLDLPAQLGHARVDPPAIELDLGLTGAARAHARCGATDLAARLP